MIPGGRNLLPARIVAAAALVAACGVERYEVAPDADDVGDGVDVLDDLWSDGRLLPDGYVFPDAGCGDGETACWGECVDLMTAGRHCGACGRACGDRGECEAGQCVCDTGYVYCPGGCARLDGDPDNCGACGVVCEEDLDCRRGECA